MLHAAGGFRENTEISLFGDPAVVVSSDNRIEGQRIDLTEMKATSSRNQRQARVSTAVAAFGLLSTEDSMENRWRRILRWTSIGARR
jgi:hypothetical protein